MLMGQEIPQFLNNKRAQVEKGCSSYWQEVIKDFSFSDNGTPVKYEGFGVNSKPNPVKQVLHRLFLQPLYHIGEKYKYFQQVLKSAESITKKQNRIINHDVFRHILTVSLCLEKIPGIQKAQYHCVIGDGLANLSSLLLLNTEARIISVNLTPILMVDYSYLAKILSPNQIAFVNDERDVNELKNKHDVRVIYIAADQHRLLRQFDIHSIYNLSSMQEMNPDIIKEYFEDIKNGKNKNPYFYCCNRVEKELPDGTVTKFSDYPWQNADVLMDEPCPWTRNYYNVKKPPFYFPYPPIQHRLVQFSAE